MRPKPLLFGYQMARLDTTQDELLAGRAALVAFAQREGYALAEVYLESDLNRPTSALAALIAASRQRHVTAIAVPAATDLGRLKRVQELTKRRLERETNVPVLIIAR